MTGSLIDRHGARKYLVSSERSAFVSKALLEDEEFATFCLTLVLSGARISEALSLEKDAIDVAQGALIFQTLKQREKSKFRLVPMPLWLLERLLVISETDAGRLFRFKRTSAWRRVKHVMRSAGIASAQCKPKALRHGFAVASVLNGVPLNLLQRWMGHARLETTIIYTDVLGDEEQMLAKRVWRPLEKLIPDLKKYH